jgi:hypothetical protein
LGLIADGFWTRDREKEPPPDAGLEVGSGGDTALRAVSDRDPGRPRSVGIVALLDRRILRVHINVNNFANVGLSLVTREAGVEF